MNFLEIAGSIFLIAIFAVALRSMYRAVIVRRPLNRQVIKWEHGWWWAIEYVDGLRVEVLGPFGDFSEASFAQHPLSFYRRKKSSRNSATSESKAMP